MERSAFLPLLAVGALAAVAGALSRVVTYLPALVGDGRTLGALGPLAVGASLLQVLVSPLAAVGLGYLFADRFAVRDRLPVAAAGVFVAAVASFAVGVAVALVGLPASAVGSQSLGSTVLDGLAVGVPGAVTLTVGVVAGAALGRLRGGAA